MSPLPIAPCEPLSRDEYAAHGRRLRQLLGLTVEVTRPEDAEKSYALPARIPGELHSLLLAVAMRCELLAEAPLPVPHRHPLYAVRVRRDHNNLWDVCERLSYADACDLAAHEAPQSAHVELRAADDALVAAGNRASWRIRHQCGDDNWWVSSDVVRDGELDMTQAHTNAHAWVTRAAAEAWGLYHLTAAALVDELADILAATGSRWCVELVLR